LKNIRFLLMLIVTLVFVIVSSGFAGSNSPSLGTGLGQVESCDYWGGTALNGFAGYICRVSCPSGPVDGVTTVYPADINPSDYFDAHPCPPVVATTSAPSGALIGRCKLVDIDSPIHLATTFTAEWRGRLNSLRLREPGASILFLQPLAGSVHWTSDNSKIATFSTLGVVDVGKYFASCLGDQGMVGAEIKTTVIR
jgi:hypothetical protein